MNFWLKIVGVFLILMLQLQVVSAQKDTMINILQAVQLDEVVISAAEDQLDLNAFIELVIEDTTFYQSFRNLRFNEHQLDVTMAFFDKKKRKKAAYETIKQQKMQSELCRQMETISETVEGNFWEKGSETVSEYFTAKMFMKLFFTNGKHCENAKWERRNINNLKGFDKQKAQLAQLIFNPGTKIEGIPMMGDKLSIFEAHNQKEYDFKIEEDNYNGKSAWKFSILLKQSNLQRADKFPITNLISYFDQDDFRILGRQYDLSFNSLYSFDIHMEVDLQSIGDELVPSKIKYEGAWKIPLKKREIGTVDVSIRP